VTAIWAVNADGTGERPLDEEHPYAEHPRWSPNGRWIAYQVQTSSFIGSGTRAHTTFDLWLVRPDGSGRRLLARGAAPLENDNPRYNVAIGAWAWSPDSRHIAFVRGPEDVGGVRVVDVATGKARFRGPGQDAAWSPDGRRLAVTASAEAYEIAAAECGTVWIVPRDRGKRRRLVRPPARACDRWPRWSPDGRWLVFARSTGEGGRPRLFAAGADGGRVQRVLPLAAARYRWPARCRPLFEYVSGYGSGWVVRPSPRAAPRFVRLPVAGTPRCDPDALEPCELAGDWRC
jgi:Tol biopolymer transport system component